MDFDDSAVETDRFDLDANQLLLLQLLKQPIEHTGFSPTIHAGVNRMPIAKPLRQSAPFAAVLGHVENRIDDREILVRDVAALARQEQFDSSKLFGADFHAASISNNSNSVNRP